ncbi:MAG: hypothetical protein Q4P23_15665, partial [Micrococcaceae bacterium]|nr:hypothetical protein [Micrococcaceae bacterium]
FCMICDRLYWMYGLAEQYMQRLAVAIGVVLSMLFWWPIRNVFNDLLGRWAGWGLIYGPEGIIGFTSDANPVGLFGGVVALFVTTALVCAPQIVMILTWRRVLARPRTETGKAVYWVVAVCGLITAGTAAVGWLDAGRGDIVLDTAWAMSAVSLFGALIATGWRRLERHFLGSSPGLVVLVALALGIVLGVTLVPLIG